MIRKFKKGNFINHIFNKRFVRSEITSITEEYYVLDSGLTVRFEDEDDFEITEDFSKLNTKGEFMDYSKRNDPRIKEMDNAIPLEVSKQLMDLGINRINLVTIYFKNGSIEVVNILEYALILELGK